VKRVDLAFARFIKGDTNGKRSGKPRFKGKNRYRTFAYQRVKPDCIQGNRIELPKLGTIKFIQHRPIPDGFLIKRALVTLKADGWHVTLTLEDASVPDNPTIDIFVEDLKVSNMTRRNKPKQDEEGNYLPNGQAAKSGLNKSFADAGIAGFLNEILPYKAAKAGRLVVKVNPAGTSVHCAICLNRVPKQLSDRWHECSCGASMPRDLNSGILIKKVGLGVVLTIKRESGKSRRRSPRCTR